MPDPAKRDEGFGYIAPKEISEANLIARGGNAPSTTDFVPKMSSPQRAVIPAGR